MTPRVGGAQLVQRLGLDLPRALARHPKRALVHAGMHLLVARGLPIEEADRIAEEVRERVHHGTDTGFCVIHIDAAETEQIAAVRQALLTR